MQDQLYTVELLGSRCAHRQRATGRKRALRIRY